MKTAVSLTFALVASSVTSIARADPFPTPMQQTTQGTYVPQSVAMSGPMELDYPEGQTAVDGYHVEQRPRLGLLIAGASTFAGAYGFTVLLGGAVSAIRGKASPMYLPFVGPLLEAADSKSLDVQMFLVGDALVQAGGAAMLVYGATTPKNLLVRNDLAPSNASTPITVRPVIGLTSAGVAGVF